MNIENLQDLLLNPPHQLRTSNSITIKDNSATPAQFQELAEKAKSLVFLSFHLTELTELPDLTNFEKVLTINLHCPNLTYISGRGFPPKLSSVRITANQAMNFGEDFWQHDSFNNLTLSGPGFTTITLPTEVKLKRLFLETLELENIKINGPQSMLETLSINTRKLKHLNSDFGNFKSLKSVKINAPLETANFKFHPDVKISGLRLLHGIPKDVSFLKSLNEVELLYLTGGYSGWSGLPDICQWETLKHLNLTNCQDTELSNQPLVGKHLKSIDLRDGLLNFRPMLFQERSELAGVSLSNMPEVNIADCIKYLPQVGGWHFHKIELVNFNELSAADPVTTTGLSFADVKNEITNFDFLDAFPNLRNLRIQGKQPISYHAFLREKPVPLEQIKIFLPDFKYKNAKQFCSLASAIFKSGLSREDQEYLVDLIANQTTLQIPKNWDLSFLLKATNIGYASFKKKLWSILEEKSEQALTNHSLNKNTVLYLSGKSKLKVKEINTFCEALGIQLVKKYDDQVTHVLVGAKSPDYDLLKNKKITLVTATALAQTYKFSQPQFLKDQEVTEDGSVPTALENLDQLLSTDDTPTLMMALEMIKQGGLPKNSIGTLMVKHKTTKDAKVRKMSKAVLELYADADWRPLLSDRGSFKNIYKPNKREVDTRRQLKDLAKRTSPTLAGNFSCLLFEKTGKGLRYALTAGLKKDLKKKAYRLLLKDQSFDFSKGLGYSERGNKNNKYEDNYVMPELSVALPVLALELDTIRTLNLTNCRYDHLSDKIGKFKDLQHLILAVNELKSLPEVFAQLTELETIDLRDNLFTKFPAVLEQLPKLTKIDLRANEGVVVPDTFLQSHPNCTVLLGE